jgi:glycosyltransferase involved in cell wall biosynthesis
MRIGINALPLDGNDDGLQAWLSGLIRALQVVDIENDYTIFCRPGAEHLLRNPDRNFEIVHVPSATRINPLQKVWNRMFSLPLIKSAELDVLHCPSCRFMPPVRSIPTVLSLHNLYPVSHPGYCGIVERLYMRTTLPPVIRRATLIHCNSHATRTVLSFISPTSTSRARVVYPGVSDIFFERSQNEVDSYFREHAFPHRPWLYVGTAEKRQNFKAVLDALAILRHKYSSRRKLIAAGFTERPGRFQRRIAELGLNGEVTFTGRIDHSSMPLLYSGSFALLAPAHAKGFGISLLEAMACGTPVITSGQGGLRECAGGAGVITESTAPYDFAEAMREMEEQPEKRAQYRDAGLLRARNFRWGTIAQKYVNLYEEAAEKKMQMVRNARREVAGELSAEKVQSDSRLTCTQSD